MTSVTEEMIEALKPCPFCGGQPVVRHWVEEYPADEDGPAGEIDVHHRIGCDDCGIEMGDEYRSEVVAAWNTRSLEAALSASPAAQTEAVTLGYTNWRGEHAIRKIVPIGVWYGSTDWHPEPQWLLKAIDVEKNAERDFALKDFGPAPSAPQPTEPVAVKPDAPGIAFPMDTAPKDGTTLRLLVQFAHDEAAGPLEDTSEPCWTIGHNSLDDTGEDEWSIVGWNWGQDAYWPARNAKPVGWLPFHSDPLASPVAQQRDEVIKLKPLVDFAHGMMTAAFNGDDVTGEEIQNLAEGLGLIRKTAYNPAVHGGAGLEVCEPGDEWYEFSPWLSPERKDQSNGRQEAK